MEGAYQILIRKLDEFIRKYYKNQLIRGALYAVATLVGLFIIINILEYFAYFNTLVRALIFWTYLLINLFILTRFLFIPVFKLYRIGKVLTHEDAARVIGKHFDKINDVLLNTLQLKGMIDQGGGSSALIEASIQQKIDRLRPIPFTAAIDLRKNKKYLKYALPPVLILLILIVAAPSTITGPTKRIVDYTTYFEKPAPFQFTIVNKKLEAIQREDFVLDVKLVGEEIPEEVFIVIGSASFRLNKESSVLYHYTFKNIQQSTKFYIQAGGFRSKDYELKVVARPTVLSFLLELDYPEYTGKKDEVLENSGDIVVPCGTKVTWRLNTRDTRGVEFHFFDNRVQANTESGNRFVYTMQCKTSQSYTVISKNEFMRNPDSMQFAINVIADQYPGIKVDVMKDSIYDKRLYFTGNIHDDYGCSKLAFKYIILKKGEYKEGQKEEHSEVPITKGATQQQFYYYYDLSELDIQPGDVVEYYFEVWDNDAINGSKSTRSQKLVFKAPSLEELEKQTEKTNEQIKDELEDAVRQTQQLQRELDKMDKKMNDKKTLSWQDKKQIQDLIDKQQDLQLKIDQLKMQNEMNNIREQEYKNPDPELLEKQKQLEKLFDDVFTDEMKEMLKQLQEMLDKLDKKQVNEMLDKMKFTNEDLEKELDRNLELFKQLEFDKKLNETIEKINELEKEQRELSEKAKNDKINADELKKQQDELNKKFDEVRKDLDDLDAKNKELEEPKNLENTDQEENAIQEQMNESSQQLGNNKKSGASKTQKQAADGMKSLSQKLEKMQEEMEQEAAEEDVNSLRQILENLISVSLDQEELMKNFKQINSNDPKFVKYMDRQKELKDDIGMIKDSLYALSKRQPMIEAIVNREISNIDADMKRAIEYLHNRNIGAAGTYQQYVMTSVNDLALLLAEALDQMQQQMNSNSNCKSGNCKKPGKGKGQKPSAATMKQMQEQLNKQMQQLKDQMDGKQPGSQGQGQQSISEQLARLAAQQEALRKMLQEYGEEDKLNGGKNSGNISEMMKDMEKTEQDLVNKMITNETLKRQQEILTRLLESEKAEKERELDEKRESNESKNQNFSNPNDFFKYNRLKSQEKELLKTVPPSLNSFYKQKVNEYFYNFVE